MGRQRALAHLDGPRGMAERVVGVAEVHERAGLRDVNVDQLDLGVEAAGLERVRSLEQTLGRRQQRRRTGAIELERLDRRERLQRDRAADERCRVGRPDRKCALVVAVDLVPDPVQQIEPAERLQPGAERGDDVADELLRRVALRDRDALLALRDGPGGVRAVALVDDPAHREHREQDDDHHRQGRDRHHRLVTRQPATE